MASLGVKSLPLRGKNPPLIYSARPAQKTMYHRCIPPVCGHRLLIDRFLPVGWYLGWYLTRERVRSMGHLLMKIGVRKRCIPNRRISTVLPDEYRVGAPVAPLGPDRPNTQSHRTIFPDSAPSCRTEGIHRDTSLRLNTFC